MVRTLARGLLREAGLLHLFRSMKGRFAGPEKNFAPADPRLIITVNRCLSWCARAGLAEGSDYLEFGIFRGFTLWYAQAIAREIGIRDMRFFGFDSFLGLPPLRGRDKGAPFYEGAFYAPRPEVETYLNRFGVDWGKTFLVEGWFDKTLVPETRKKYGLRNVSVCVFDSDLYCSATRALQFIEPILRDRSVILFDDWNDFGHDPEKGEAKAFSEFLKENPHIQPEPFEIFGEKGKGFILRVKAGPSL